VVEHRPSQDCIILGVLHVCIRNNGHEMSNAWNEAGQSEASKFDRGIQTVVPANRVLGARAQF